VLVEGQLDGDIHRDGLVVAVGGAMINFSLILQAAEYLARLEQWQNKVEKSGGHWRVINDLDGLEGLL
jgi:hypothetical protein